MGKSKTPPPFQLMHGLFVPQEGAGEGPDTKPPAKRRREAIQPEGSSDSEDDLNRFAAAAVSGDFIKRGSKGPPLAETDKAVKPRVPAAAEAIGLVKKEEKKKKKEKEKKKKKKKKKKAPTGGKEDEKVR